MAMRDLLPSIGTMKVWTVTHKDNLGCLKLTEMDPVLMTPRRKYYGLKYHWFRSKLKPSDIKVSYIKSKDQRADSQFKANQLLTFGWWNYHPSPEKECNDIHLSGYPVTMMNGHLSYCLTVFYLHVVEQIVLYLLTNRHASTWGSPIWSSSSNRL
jgi:hypothetical protein